MRKPGLGALCLLSSMLCLAAPSIAQNPAPSVRPHIPAAAPAATFQINSRMVTVELVARDSNGNHITGLKAEDLHLFEQTPSQSKEKRKQRITSLREIRMADFAREAIPEVPTSAGVYSNGVKRPKEAVPPTIVLVDGLNTDIQYQAQVHVQMLRMLRQLPPNVPVAVFLLGGRLSMLQSFTTDSGLLQTALQKAESLAGKGVADIDPADDPYATGNIMSVGGVAPGLGAMIAAAKEFDRRIYTANMDMKVQRTINALVSLSRNLAGYPGRKNLLWLSTYFPIAINSDEFYRNYWAQLQKMDGALSEAKVSVYPINVAGVQTLSFFSAASMPPDVSPGGAAAAVSRQQTMLSNQQTTMEAIADGTGGKICTGDNNLGDCVRKAMDDSSDYYELSYYPDSPSWNGAYRKVLISTDQRGAKLAYRQGYFATPQGGSDPKAEQAALQSECEDYLDATSVIFTARSMPADKPGELRYSISIDPTALTMAPTSDGGYEMKLALAVCTFNQKGWPLQLMNFPIDRKLDARQHDSLLANGSVEQAILVPGPKPEAVLLMVKDVASGRLGSIHVKVDETAQGSSQTARE